jgi:integrase
MANLKNPLSVKELEQLRDQGLHAVGGVPGLLLKVSSGGRSWIYRYTFEGLRKKVGLGPLTTLGLREARELARDLSLKIRAGIDPCEIKKVESVETRSSLSAHQDASTRDDAKVRGKRGSKVAISDGSAAKPIPLTPTFESCVRQYILAHRSSWANAKHEAQWQSTLDRYAMPVIGRLNPSEITVEHLLEILSPIWSTKTETASRVRSRIELVLNFARAKKLRSGENPALWRGNLDSLLPKPRKVAPVKHHEAVDVDAGGSVFQSIRAMDSIGARCLEFTILTASRSGESRGALWAEIDLERALWTIPARRMKMKRDHRIPLSGAAMGLLRRMPRFDNTDLVFSSPQKVHLARPLSDMTLTACHRRLQLSATVHGWRSTFKDWAAEKTSYANELSEMALAHAISSGVESAYRRGDLFERRRAMMDEWAEFLARRG